MIHTPNLNNNLDSLSICFIYVKIPKLLMESCFFSIFFKYTTNSNTNCKHYIIYFLKDCLQSYLSRIRLSILNNKVTLFYFERFKYTYSV